MPIISLGRTARIIRASTKSEYRKSVPIREIAVNRWLTYTDVKRILNSKREFHNRR
jgi:hypothetical protein